MHFGVVKGMFHNTHIAVVVKTRLEVLGVGRRELQLDSFVVHLHCGGSVEGDTSQALGHVGRELELLLGQRAGGRSSQLTKLAQREVDDGTSLVVKLTSGEQKGTCYLGLVQILQLVKARVSLN